MPATDSSRRPQILAAGGIGLAGLAAYANTFGNALVYPHIVDIAGNPSIRRLWPIGPVLNPPATGGMTVGGRPLLNLSLAVNYALGGTAVAGYHAVNLLIHILAGLTLFGIVRRTAERRLLPDATPFAFAVAWLWTLHPLQTESVTYVIERAESLMGLFYLLTVYCFIRYAEGADASERRPCPTRDGRDGSPSRPPLWAILSVLCCLLGMATKEVMASAPVIVFLYDRTFVSGSFRRAWRHHRRLHLGLAATWILLGDLAWGARARGGTAGFGAGISWWAYAETQFSAIVHYLRLAVWPHPLVFDYGSRWARGPGEVIPCALAVAVLIGATIDTLRRRPAAGFLGVFFFAILAPSSLVPVFVQTLAERRMYLALAPVAVGFVWVLRWALEVGRSGPDRRLDSAVRAGPPYLPIVIALGLVLAAVTAARNRDYRDNATLWGLTARQRPDNPRAHYYYGVSLDETGRPAAAMAEFQTALALLPNYAEAHNRLGIDLLASGRTAEAMDHYAAAIRERPEFAQAHYNLGTALAQNGRLLEGVAELAESVRLDPENAEAHNNLGRTLAGLGRWTEAIAEYRQALRLDPGYALAQNNLAEAERAAAGGPARSP